jgi:Holliday junction resolvasome RuvABC endonuclease subunit
MRVIGLDPAFANFGMVAGVLESSRAAWAFKPTAMRLLQTQGDGKKREVRKSSENLRRARELHEGLCAFLDEHPPELVFVEVPSGAQNANAAMGLGIAVGILGSIKAPIIEVAPIEIKRLFTPRQEIVPKARIIKWAYDAWPQAPWLTHGGRRTLNNEHLADACATVVAGLVTPTFKQLLALRGAHEVPLPDHDGHPHGGQPHNRVPLGSVPVDKPAGRQARRSLDPDTW